MEVPAPADGIVGELLLKVGDRVKEGSSILTLSAEGGAAASAPTSAPAAAPAPAAAAEFKPEPIAVTEGDTGKDHRPGAAGRPAGRAGRFRQCVRLADRAPPRARAGDRPEQGRRHRRKGPRHQGGRQGLPVRRQGRPGRGVSGGAGIPEIPAVDFSKFGPIEEKPLSRIRKMSGPFLHRSWLNVPAVTQHDEADVTELEAFRKSLDDEGKAAKPKPYRVSLLPFLMKASVAVLKEFPDFNSSLNPAKDGLIHKKYWHIGFACDTPEGLVVPVIRNVDQKGVLDLSRELGELSAKARDGKLSPAEMSGATFTISSLGGIGGTGFTPIVNAPEVAILGVVRSKMAPQWNGKEFVPRLMLPLSLSYDHRVIDGAAAARFARALATRLEDIRRLAL